MVHVSSLIPGMSKFIDENVLAQYSPNSMKRILMAGAISLYLKQNEGLVDTLASNPLVVNLGVVKPDGMIDIESIRDSLKKEISKAGFMRVSIPFVGDIDFTPEDADALYKFIIESNTQINSPPVGITTPTSSTVLNGGIY